MILRILPSFFLVLSLLLFAAAGYDYFYLQDAPGAVVAEPNRTFPVLAVGKNEVKFRLDNPTRHAVRVVGFQFC